MILGAAIVTAAGGQGASKLAPVYRIDHVVDGDTVALRNGLRVRLVQIDTPEVYFGTDGSAPSSGASSLTATSRSSSASWARSTSAVAPRPST